MNVNFSCLIEFEVDILFKLVTMVPACLKIIVLTGFYSLNRRNWEKYERERARPLERYVNHVHIPVGSMEAPSKAFLLLFLLPDWLKLNRLKSRMECGFSDIFLCHICSTVAETIGVTNYAVSFGSKKCSRDHI